MRAPGGDRASSSSGSAAICSSWTRSSPRSSTEASYVSVGTVSAIFKCCNFGHGPKACHMDLRSRKVSSKSCRSELSNIVVGRR